MIQDLEFLLQLQEIDLRIHEQEVAQEQFPAEVADLESGIEKAKAVLASAQAKLEKAEKDRKTIEDQASKAKDMLDKSQERLNSIKTNREYDAVHAEIETNKNIVSGAETKKKTLTDEIEKYRGLVDEAGKNLESVKTENEPKIAELKAKIAAIDSTIAQITEERTVVLPKVSKPSLRTYDQIRKKRKSGKAISVVSSSRTCTVCYKVLEPQLVNEIKRGNKMIICQNCGSIMIWNDAAKAAPEA